MTKINRIPMGRDGRYTLLIQQLAHGNIQKFSDIFLYVPKTIIALDMGMKVERFNAYFFDNPEGFKIGHFTKLGEKLKIDHWELLHLLMMEMSAKSKKKQILKQ